MCILPSHAPSLSLDQLPREKAAGACLATDSRTHHHKGFRLLPSMLGHSKAHLGLGMVIHRVVLLQERDAKDEQRAVGRWHVHGHQSDLARSSLDIVDIVLWVEAQDAARDDEPQ